MIARGVPRCYMSMLDSFNIIHIQSESVNARLRRQSLTGKSGAAYVCPNDAVRSAARLQQLLARRPPLCIAPLAQCLRSIECYAFVD